MGTKGRRQGSDGGRSMSVCVCVWGGGGGGGGAISCCCFCFCFLILTHFCVAEQTQCKLYSL